MSQVRSDDRRSTRGILFVISLATIAAPVGAEPPPHRSTTQPATAPSSPDERLWQRIDALCIVAEMTGAAADADWFIRDTRRKRDLLDALAQYLTMYPGGEHRDRCIELQLSTLFELGVADGSLAVLQHQLDAYIRTPPSRFALEEAAWWRLVVGPVIDVVDRSGVPMRLGVAQSSERRAMADYIATFPASRHSPWLCERLFEFAQQSGDRNLMSSLCAEMQREFPRQPVTDWMLAAARRFDAVGEPLRIRFRATDGRFADTAEDMGSPVLIVVWASFDRTSVDVARDIELFRIAHPQFRVYGVNLEESPLRTDIESVQAELPWPQWNDGLGWAHEFVRTWAIRELPAILTIGDDGILCGIAEGEDWVSWTDLLPPEP